MGVAAYLVMVASTFWLLTIVKAETISEKEILPDCFDDSVWTFSNARHTEHKRMKRPTSNTLITARPAKFTSTEMAKREFVSTIVCLGLVGSYVTNYLAIRVAPWWVAISSLGAIWFGAAYRAIVSQNSIVAEGDHMDSAEYWTGIFEANLSETLLKIIDIQRPRSYIGSHQSSDSNPAVSMEDPPEKISPAIRTYEVETQGPNAILLVVEPVRMGLGTWSGAEDVMKVALEMSKRICKSKVITYKSQSLAQNSRWTDIVRFNLAIYVPGMVWTSHQTIDIGLPCGFSFDTLIQLVTKVLHVSMDQEGTAARHTIETNASVPVSHVLCGPIAESPLDSLPSDKPQTLRSVLSKMGRTREPILVPLLRGIKVNFCLTWADWFP
jgi:hypothetical protein